MEEKHLYVVGFSRRDTHFSFKALLTDAEYVKINALLEVKADSHEVVMDVFYRWEESAETLESSINDLLGW